MSVCEGKKRSNGTASNFKIIENSKLVTRYSLETSGKIGRVLAFPQQADARSTSQEGPKVLGQNTTVNAQNWYLGGAF